MLETFFRRDALKQFFVRPPTLRPASAVEILQIVLNAAVPIIAVGKQRTAVALEICRNRLRIIF